MFVMINLVIYSVLVKAAYHFDVRYLAGGWGVLSFLLNSGNGFFTSLIFSFISAAIAFFVFNVVKGASDLINSLAVAVIGGVILVFNVPLMIWNMMMLD